MKCSAKPQALKNKGRLLPTHMLLIMEGFPSMQLTENKLTHTSGIHGHNIDETPQLSHTFKLCNANPYTPANAIFTSSDTACASCQSYREKTYNTF